MALLDALKSAVMPTDAMNAIQANHPMISEHRKKLRWLIMNPPGDGKRMTVTPEMAAVMMERNADDEWRNRPHSEKGAARYERSMKKGWKYTGETIIFSESGRLLNGQHRLMACIRAGVPFECLFAFGISEDAFKFMDTGIARSAGHIFAIENIPNANQVAAAARLLYGYKRSQAWEGRAPDVENDDLLSFYELHPRLQDALSPARQLYEERLMPFRWGTFCFYICAEKSRQEAERFFETLATGLGIATKRSPIYMVRKRLLENARVTNGKLSDAHVGAYLIKAWNAQRSGTPLGVIKWRTEQSPSEPFPRAI